MLVSVVVAARTGSCSELHSAASRLGSWGGVSGAKLSRSSISARMADESREMVSLVTAAELLGAPEQARRGLGQASPPERGRGMPSAVLASSMVTR